MQGAFIGWQVQETLKGLLGHKKAQGFNDYLKVLNLIEKDKQPKRNRKIEKEKALQDAAKIVELDKRRRGDKLNGNE